MSHAVDFTRTMGRQRSLGLLVDSQRKLVSSPRPTIGQLVCHAPYIVKAESGDVTALTFDGEACVDKDQELDPGYYRVNLQIALHHEDRVAAILGDTYHTFRQPVTYHPSKLLTAMIQSLRTEISKNSNTICTLYDMRHPSLDSIFIVEDTPDAILKGKVFVDELAQQITITVPIGIIGNVPDELTLFGQDVSFDDSLNWGAETQHLEPSFREYTIDVDSAELHDDDA